MKLEHHDNREIILVNCPHPDCEEVEEYEINSKQINFECDQGHKFCVKCKKEVWHDEEKCTRVKFNFKKRVKKFCYSKSEITKMLKISNFVQIAIFL